MSACVNLMTERAKFVAAGARIGNAWAAVVLGLVVLLVPFGAWTWRHRAAVVRQRDALDASYEPIRQMSAANRAVSSQAAVLVARENVPLSLARRRPFTAVLLAISEAVAATEGSAFVANLRYGQGAAPPAGDAAPWFVTLDVSCTPSFDMAQLVEALKRSPFIEVKMLSSSPGGDGAERKLYVLQCEL